MKNNKLNIYFKDEYINSKFKFKKAEKDMKRLLNEIGKEVGEPIEASIYFISSGEIKEMNKTHRGIDKATDVLSFPHNEKEEKFLYIGDILINNELIEEQAESIGSEPLTEVKFLTMHGLLHLIGYDHMNKKDEEKMCKRQRELFTKLKIRNDLKDEDSNN